MRNNKFCILFVPLCKIFWVQETIPQCSINLLSSGLDQFYTWLSRPLSFHGMCKHATWSCYCLVAWIIYVFIRHYAIINPFKMVPWPVGDNKQLFWLPWHDTGIAHRNHKQLGHRMIIFWAEAWYIRNEFNAHIWLHSKQFLIENSSMYINIVKCLKCHYVPVINCCHLVIVLCIKT